MPSKKMLAEDFGTSVITVQHAYEMLCDEWYVESVERSGYYVSYRQDNWFSTNDMTIENMHSILEPIESGEFERHINHTRRMLLQEKSRKQIIFNNLFIIIGKGIEMLIIKALKYFIIVIE